MGTLRMKMRIRGTVNYYNNVTRNLLDTKNLPISVGVSSIKYYLCNGVVKGIYKDSNPMYAYKVYNHFKKLATKNNLNYVEYPSDIHSSKVQPIGPDDKVIGFSKGGFYADKLKTYFGAQGKFINIGAKDYPGADHYIDHPFDKTSMGDHGPKSLKSHWTLTNKMKKNLSNIIGETK